MDLEERWQAMEALSKLPVDKIWEPWGKIAAQVIPEGWELKDALEGCDMPIMSEYAQGSPELAEEIKHRIGYWGDRLDEHRAYMLDYEIRYYFGKPMRELDPELGYQAGKANSVRDYAMTKAKLLELLGETGLDEDIVFQTPSVGGDSGRLKFVGKARYKDSETGEYYTLLDFIEK